MAEVVAAWPKLPARVKRGIVANIRRNLLAIAQEDARESQDVAAGAGVEAIGKE